jgi:tyrosine-protein kinase Etk/Wzc
MEFLRLWEILLRRKRIFLVTFLILFTIIVATTFIIPSTYESRAKLLVQKSDTLSSLLTNLGIQTREREPSTTTPQYDTDVQLAKVRPLLEKLISSLNLKDRSGDEITPEDLVDWDPFNKIYPQPYISVDQYEDADIMEIVSNSSDPDEAANMANELAHLYINNEIQRAKEEFSAARLFLEGEIEQVKGNYYDSLSAMKKFRVKERSVDLELETDNLINKIGSLRTTIEEQERQIFGLQRELDLVQSKIEMTARYRKEYEEFSRSDQLNVLKTRLNELLVSIASRSIDFSKEHPSYKEIETQIEIVRDLIQDEAKTVLSQQRLSIDPIYDRLTGDLIQRYIDKEVTLVKKRLLAKYIDEYEKKLLSFPQKYVQNAKLDLDIVVNQGIYKNLRTYLIQLGLAESVTLSHIRIVESASVATDPEFPKKGLNFSLGGLLSLFCALSLSLFVEYVDTTIRSPDDVKKAQWQPLLGIIPKSTYLKKPVLISDLDPTSPVLEAFRTVRNSFIFASEAVPLKSITVTSALEKDGKTSTAANLSVLLSRAGKRVVLVDLNLRAPQLHNVFHISNSKGITDIISQNLDQAEAVTATSIEGLDLIPSGPVPVDPSSVVESPRLGQVLEQLELSYDVVIIDTPALLRANDAIPISRRVGGVIFVIQSGKTTSKMLDHARELMNSAQLNLAGSILNKFSQGRSFYHLT